MSSPAVSVALCTYNGERFLEQQFESILTQTHRPAEVVVADDGSTDGTALVLDRLIASSDIPVRRLAPGDRLGVTANFERAVRACVSPYVALADQDDVWHSDRLAAAVTVLDSDSEVMLVHSDARLVDADGLELGRGLLESLTPSAGERRALASRRPLAAYLRRNFVTGTTVTFRRDLLDLAAPFPADWVHDEWLAAVAAVIGKVCFLDRPLVDYRQHGSNEIGVVAPSLRGRFGRMGEQRGDRLRRLARRASVLAERMAGSADPATAAAIRGKAEFERRRGDYPASRARRVGPILRQWRDYPRFASQGRADMVRDLVQPA